MHKVVPHLLQGQDGRTLESQFGPAEILRDLSDESLEGELADQELGGLLRGGRYRLEREASERERETVDEQRAPGTCESRAEQRCLRAREMRKRDAILQHHAHNIIITWAIAVRPAHCSSSRGCCSLRATRLSYRLCPPRCCCCLRRPVQLERTAGPRVFCGRVSLRLLGGVDGSRSGSGTGRWLRLFRARHLRVPPCVHIKRVGTNG